MIGIFLLDDWVLWHSELLVTSQVQFLPLILIGVSLVLVGWMWAFACCGVEIAKKNFNVYFNLGSGYNTKIRGAEQVTETDNSNST